MLAEAPLHRLFLLTMNPFLFLAQPTCLWLETRQIMYPMLMCDDLLAEEVIVLKVHAIIIVFVARMVVLRRWRRTKRLYLVHLLLLLSPMFIHKLFYLFI